MKMPWRPLRHLAAPLMAALLAACVVIPVPFSEGYRPETRANLPAQQPQTIAAGRSTRADVLLALGTPDLQGPDEAWLAYFSAFHKGGVLFEVMIGSPAGAIPLGAIGHVSTYQNRSLVVRFDATGLLECVAFEQIEETKGLREIVLKPEENLRVAPCLTTQQIAEALRPSPLLEAPAADEPSSPTEFKGGWFLYTTASCSLFTAISMTDGVVRLSPTTLDLVALSRDGVSIRIPYEKITALRPGIKPLTDVPPPLEVTFGEASCISLFVFGNSRDDLVATRAKAAEELEVRTGLKVQHDSRR
jgi:outer membrane protein assembly factor BamE (lipoprotein component of BamABCDE complex)